VEDAESVREAGVTAIFSLCRKAPDPAVIATVENWVHMPIPDRRKGAPPLEDLRAIVGLILGALSSGETVLVHCVEGRNRSVLAAVLAERARNHWTGLQAWEHADIMRPNCLNNKAFADWLRSLP
jgi:hypothetical protein